MGSLLPCKLFQSEFRGGTVILPDAISTRKAERNYRDLILLGESLLFVCISLTSSWSSAQTEERKKRTFFISEVCTTGHPYWGQCGPRGTASHETESASRPEVRRTRRRKSIRSPFPLSP